jgi:hypothetical protein
VAVEPGTTDGAAPGTPRGATTDARSWADADAVSSVASAMAIEKIRAIARDRRVEDVPIATR